MSKSLVSRRHLLYLTACLCAGSFSEALAEAKLTAEGLYEEPWLLKTTTDLRKDFAATADAGKTFVVMWEMRGCPWCKILHTVNFVRPDISAYLQENFGVLQLSIRGNRQLVDFDGEALAEEALALKYNVFSTPTLQFFVGSSAAKAREVGRVQYLKPDQFLLLLKFVREKGYEDGPFDEWIKTRGGKI